MPNINLYKDCFSLESSLGKHKNTSPGCKSYSPQSNLQHVYRKTQTNPLFSRCFASTLSPLLHMANQLRGKVLLPTQPQAQTKHLLSHRGHLQDKPRGAELAGALGVHLALIQILMFRDFFIWRFQSLHYVQHFRLFLLPSSPTVFAV